MWNNTDEAVEFIQQVRPSTVLDMRMGTGKWAYLIRGSMDRAKVTIEGLRQLNKKYFFPWSYVQAYLYNRIYLIDLMDFEFTDSYDMIIVEDVLERLNKKQCNVLLKRILQACGSFIFVTPVGKTCYGLLPTKDKRFRVRVYTTKAKKRGVHTFLGKRIPNG